MYYFYGRVNRGHVACPLYGGCPYLGVFIMGGSTVVHVELAHACIKILITLDRNEIWARDLYH